jgi:hypothetical protein
VSAVFDDTTSGSISKVGGSIGVPTKDLPVLTYKYPGGNATGLVVIKYTVKNNAGQTSGRVFINIGSTRPLITSVNTVPTVDYNASVIVTSVCKYCDETKTTYQWTYVGDVVGNEKNFVAPDGADGETLVLK